ncbi:uncharacterized protein LOC133779940 [Humulus lupulus]|uniref:uncharacterized protein LOC133779940 n=1 Tax=Humulus lupulus TaxID=3486 RepID=UPI002B4136FE|nr:uncharacterized protein LOC133779940 [Humulus lupulus]
MKGSKTSRFMEHQFPNWDYHTRSVIEGCLLIVWRRLSVKVIILEESTQAVHCLVKMTGVQQVFGVNFVYGFNSIEGRRSLWEGFQRPIHMDKARLILGDFNAPFSGKDRSGGAHVEPLKSVGSYFTWTNNQDGAARIYSKIDHVLINEKWFDLFPQSTAMFRWEIISDHCSCLVLKSWRTPIKATGIKAVYLKLLRLKHCLKSFTMDRIGDLKANYNKAKEAYQEAQMQAQAYPHRSKITWLRQGDLNTSFFYAFLKKRKAENGIVSFITEEEYRDGFKVSVEQHVMLLKPFSKKEIRESLFSIPITKSPGLDGFGSGFFKAVWHDIGDEVGAAISQCFETGHFPSELTKLPYL